MNEHLFLPGVQLTAVQLLPEYKAWLTAWLREGEDDIARADVSSSMCLQGAISELALYGKVQTDWPGIMDAYLSHDGVPIAYSERYGRRLYAFSHQWLQSDVHAIHARWWIERVCSSPFETLRVPYGKLIESLVQENGWIYNPSVSATQFKTRMKSEYMLSMAMGLEILQMYHEGEDRQEHFEATLSSVPLTGYLSAEYFRLHALKTLHALALMPVKEDAVLALCQTERGYCDFSVQGKVDEYMGTKKRSARDVAVPSPLACLHAYALASLLDEQVQKMVLTRITDYGRYVLYHPLEIPAFQIRDIDIPFGSDVTPLEIIAASTLIGLVTG